jgi:DNA-binding transcriptional LysR family regulator
MLKAQVLEFDRLSCTVEMSDHESARRAIEEADKADLAARDEGAGLVGRLRVSAAVTFASLHILPRLPAFLAAHPGPLGW